MPAHASTGNETGFDKAILAFCDEKIRTQAETTEHLGISSSSCLWDRVLLNLVNQGMLEMEQTGRAKRYRTKPEAVTDLGAAAGADPRMEENMDAQSIPEERTKG